MLWFPNLGCCVCILKFLNSTNSFEVHSVLITTLSDIFVNLSVLICNLPVEILCEYPILQMQLTDVILY